MAGRNRPLHFIEAGPIIMGAEEVRGGFSPQLSFLHLIPASFLHLGPEGAPADIAEEGRA